MHHLSKKWKFNPLKMHEKAPGGQKSNFPIQIIRKWAICRKNINFSLWKCARMHERAPRGRFLLSEHAPNHAWHTKGGINGKSHIRKCIICRKNEHFTVWKCMKRRLVGKKAIFQYWEFPEMPPSQEGVGHAWRFFNVACFDATSYCKS